MVDNTQFNAALPPSTVHLPKMFWVALDVKCHGDMKSAAEDLRTLTVISQGKGFWWDTSYVSCEHTIKQGGVQIKGE